jgi:hypothetical protein
MRDAPGRASCGLALAIRVVGAEEGIDQIAHWINPARLSRGGACPLCRSAGDRAGRAHSIADRRGGGRGQCCPMITAAAARATKP